MMMDKADMIYIASVGLVKNMDYEELMYSDYLYDKENMIDEVWEYVVEGRDDGITKFREKYKDFKLYWITLKIGEHIWSQKMKWVLYQHIPGY